MEWQIISRVLIVLLVVQITVFHLSMGYKILVLHPIYSGSHVLTVHKISRELVKRGNDVLTIRYKDTHNLKLEKPSEREHSDENIQLRTMFT